MGDCLWCGEPCGQEYELCHTCNMIVQRRDGKRLREWIAQNATHHAVADSVRALPSTDVPPRVRRMAQDGDRPEFDAQAEPLLEKPRIEAPLPPLWFSVSD